VTPRPWTALDWSNAVYELTVERDFSAAHLMRDYPGACARLHGHNYRVLLTVEGEDLDDSGMLMDFAELKRAFEAILGELDHRNLNEIQPFDEMNPSSENLARYIYQRADDALGDQVEVASVTIYESTTSSVTYREG
jgi:6-pyruvoyltetrahydropterin/6-carboxytetrahydropterin synthase